MREKLLFLLLLIIAGCSNPAPKETNVKAPAPVKSAAPAAKPVNPWKTGSYAPKEGETEGRKYVRFVTDGVYSDSTKSNNYLFAEVIVNTANAGILLRELKKSNPAEKFSEPVEIRMTNVSGEELQMTSARSWNSSGGIMIERNNNDYSRFRIYMLQSKGIVTVEIRASGNRIYNFKLNADGFSDSFTAL